jgi:hypothetical protein
MKRIVIGLILIYSLLIPTIPPVNAADYTDFRTPQIQALSQKSSIVFEQGEYLLKLEYEVKVKTFKNELSGMKFFFVRDRQTYPAGCQLLPTDWAPLLVSYGQDFSTKLDSLKVPQGLVKLEKIADYQIETHSFSFSTSLLN